MHPLATPGSWGAQGPRRRASARRRHLTGGDGDDVAARGLGARVVQQRVLPVGHVGPKLVLRQLLRHPAAPCAPGDLRRAQRSQVGPAGGRVGARDPRGNRRSQVKQPPVGCLSELLHRRGHIKGPAPPLHDRAAAKRSHAPVAVQEALPTRRCQHPALPARHRGCPAGSGAQLQV